MSPRLSVGIGGSMQPLSTEEVDMEIAAVFWSTRAPWLREGPQGLLLPAEVRCYIFG